MLSTTEEIVEDQPMGEPVIENLDKGSVIFLEDVIMPETINPIVQYIMMENITNPNSEHITIFIDSPGGDAFAAMKLIDIMKMSKIPVRTVGIGSVASAALLILMSGHERLVSVNTSVMSHQATFSAERFSAKMSDLDAHQKDMANVAQRMLDIYCEATKLSAKVVKNKLLNHHDVYLTAKEAVEYGLVDDLLQNRKDVFWDLLARGNTSDEETA